MTATQKTAALDALRRAVNLGGADKMLSHLLPKPTQATRWGLWDGSIGQGSG